MLLAPRSFAFLVLASATLFATGCSSNNKGKIEGKWKLVSAPGLDPSIKVLEMGKAYIYFEFKPDGTVESGPAIEGDEKNEELLKAGESTKKTGNYKLKAGNKVEFTGPEDKGGGFFGKSGKEYFEVAIDGDTMTITGSDGNMKLVRVK